MYLQQLKNISCVRGLRQADLARISGVSRAAVSKWFKEPQGICNVGTKTLLSLARGLGVTPDLLLKECDDISPLKTRFLWDRIYPSMESFALALARGNLIAIARLVQVTGFRRGARVAGRKAVTLFPRYKKYIKPARRLELEILWPLYLPKK